MRIIAGQDILYSEKPDLEEIQFAPKDIFYLFFGVRVETPANAAIGTEMTWYGN